MLSSVRSERLLVDQIWYNVLLVHRPWKRGRGGARDDGLAEPGPAAG